MAGVNDRINASPESLPNAITVTAVTPLSPVTVGECDRVNFALGSLGVPVVIPIPGQFDAHTNLAVSAVATAPSPATTGTTLAITGTQQSWFPTPPFNATVWPAGAAATLANSEIVRVVAVTSGTYTVLRTQEGTNARAITVGDQFAATITAKTLTDVETAVKTVAAKAVGYPVFIQTTDPVLSGLTGGLTKWMWINTSTAPPTVDVYAATDVATTTLSIASADDVKMLAIMGALI